MQQYLEKLARESSTPYLFAQRPCLPFRSTRSECPDCHASLRISKTRTKTVHTLHLGSFTAQETLLYCDHCPNPTSYASEELSRLVPAGSTFGYDVMIFVGQALFRRHRRAEEIIQELRARNVRLSASEVAYLGKRFVVHLAWAHRQSAPRLKKAMRAQGGYILHLDATGEAGPPMLMSSLDSISEIVLGNVKIPSEKTEEIIPFLKEIKARYGVPLAAVHDMGVGILAAVKVVFPGVPDFICHFHFLRDVGKDLLEPDYDAIPAQADEFPLLSAYSLTQWMLEGKTQGEGYGFPFDRPQLEFARRLQGVAQELEVIKEIHLRGQWQDNVPLFKLAHALKPLAADAGLRRMIEVLEVKIQVFDQLRGAMRIAEVGGSAGLNSGSAPLAMGSIQKAVQEFRRRITARGDYPSTGHWKAMIAQIDKYGAKLFADPITVPTPHGRLRIQPQRTNNIMERFFRDFRRGARRKSGHNSLSKFLQSMIADTPLVKNLENPDYLQVLLNGQPNLEACFAQMDIETVRQEMQTAQNWSDRVPRKIQRLVNMPAFPTALCGLFRKPLVKTP
ncbi:MAG: transposase [Candidatus Aminicenantes bacterium]|nr:transposase [Candidatus Aminicenantes bacterium]